VSYHNHLSIRVHVIFATKDRRPSIPEELLTELWMYIGGICRNLKFKLYAVGGMRDHLHIFFALPTTEQVSVLVQKLKANTSRFLHQKGVANFAWQEGYGAFSVSQSNSAAVVRYIRLQRDHHRRVSFQEEFVAFLKKSGVPYDERYVWG